MHHNNGWKERDRETESAVWRSLPSFFIVIPSLLPGQVPVAFLSFFTHPFHPSALPPTLPNKRVQLGYVAQVFVCIGSTAICHDSFHSPFADDGCSQQKGGYSFRCKSRWSSTQTHWVVLQLHFAIIMMPYFVDHGSSIIHLSIPPKVESWLSMYFSSNTIGHTRLMPSFFIMLFFYFFLVPGWKLVCHSQWRSRTKTQHESQTQRKIGIDTLIGFMLNSSTNKDVLTKGG